MLEDSYTIITFTISLAIWALIFIGVHKLVRFIIKKIKKEL
jgi:hypothetical protein